MAGLKALTTQDFFSLQFMVRSPAIWISEDKVKLLGCVQGRQGVKVYIPFLLSSQIYISLEIMLLSNKGVQKQKEEEGKK